jgi:hypothetical protein
VLALLLRVVASLKKEMVQGGKVALIFEEDVKIVVVGVDVEAVAVGVELFVAVVVVVGVVGDY